MSRSKSKIGRVHKTVVINVVGLTKELLAHMPALRKFAEQGKVATIGHVTPAVTCSVQATYLTGKLPSEHGIVGNGWYDRDDCEVKFWKQSDKLVQSPRIWDIARKRDPSFTCANLFWWYAMYSSCDVTVTPRPQYPADGRKIPDVWTHPARTRDTLQSFEGRFPLFNFWGPTAAIASSKWISRAAKWCSGAVVFDAVEEPHSLTLIYIPQLDYTLQRVDSSSAIASREAAQTDEVLANLLHHFVDEHKSRVVLLSEYGIESVSNPLHINRHLRANNLLQIREESGRELLDAGASRAFAVADHQIAHIYLNDLKKMDEVEQIVKSMPGVESVLRGAAKAQAGLDHPRAGDLIAIAEPGAWFTYYYWLDDNRAPDFARTVDIHRKPGYDPVELFLDPKKPFIKARIAWKLLKRKLGFRALLDVIPLDATLVKGSHGRPPSSREKGPVFITNQPQLLERDHVEATDVCELILRHVFDA